VVIVQCDAFNRVQLETLVCACLTSNLKWAEAPGNVLLSSRVTRLPRDSVANVSQLLTLDQSTLDSQAGTLGSSHLALIIAGIDCMLRRSAISH